MFLVTIEERNGEFEYTHHMLMPSLPKPNDLADVINDKPMLEDFYGEDSVGEEDVKGFYWLWGEQYRTVPSKRLLARVVSIQSLTDDEAATLVKFL